MTEEFNDEEPHYLLDTNIVSEIIKNNPDFNVIKKIAEHNSDCAICTPVWQELLFDMYRMSDGVKKNYLKTFIENDVHETFKIKQFTESAARIQAHLRSELEKSGRPTQKADSMIAAIALANHMVLVTRNTRHFEAIQEVSELQVENWFEQ